MVWTTATATATATAITDNTFRNPKPDAVSVIAQGLQLSVAPNIGVPPTAPIGSLLHPPLVRSPPLRCAFTPNSILLDDNNLVS